MAVQQLRRWSGSRWEPVALGTLGVVGFLALWEGASRSGLLTPDVAPSASEALQRLGELLRSREFWVAVASTLRAWATGTAITLLVAVPVGLVLGASRRAWDWVQSVVEAMRPIPPIVVLPLAILVVGATSTFNTVLIAQGVLWLLLIQITYASSAVSDVALDTAKVFRIGRLRRYAFIRLPAALPIIATSVRLAAAIALAVEIMAELIGGVPGLGQLLITAQAGNDLRTIYAVTIFIGLLGLVVGLVLRQAEALALRSHGPKESA